jgi:peptide/nickel transport system ATP-binding protein
MLPGGTEGRVGPTPDRLAPSDSPLIEVENLQVRFDTPRGRLRAVDGVSFSLRRGETLGVVGESGSGKSVLVRSIMNILPRDTIRPPGQRLVFDGRDVATLTPAQRKHFWGTEMAMVFQDPMTSLNPVRRIGTQLTESMRFHLGMSRSAAQARALDLLKLVGIPEPGQRLRQYPHELSGGMRQRITIAIALACNPKLLIADEPTTALDVTVQKQILDLLDGLQAELGMSTILITHDLGVVAGRAHRTAVMYAGRIVEIADTLSLFEETRHPYTEALLNSIPRIEASSHQRLDAIAGRPPDMIGARTGCAFAPRCAYAQAKCLTDDPALRGPSAHQFRCHFPVGTPEGAAALEANRAGAVTAAGMQLTAKGT